MLKTEKLIPLKVSKWVKIPFLIDEKEMEDLIQSLPPFSLYDVQKVCEQGEGQFTPQLFLQTYAEYVQCLKRGEVPLLKHFHPLFSTVWSMTEKALYALEIEGGKQLLKPLEPVVQLQINQIRYSKEEHLFRTQVFSQDSLTWGVQVGFPNLYLNPETFEATSTREFANMSLFQAIQSWIRKHTRPTPFVIDGKKINAPIRIGKACFAWIHSHPQLKAQGISIAGN